MSDRRKPFQTSQKAKVKYPSGLFSLEKDEVFSYERFAYNVLDVGIPALHQKKLPECLTVDFTHLSDDHSAWLINCSALAKYSPDGDPISFTISIPELVPALFYMFCGVVLRQLYSGVNIASFKADIDKFRSLIQNFINGASASVRHYKEKGIGPAIRAGYDFFNLSFYDLYNIGNDFDLLTKQIAHHEIAHLYISNLSQQTKAVGTKRLAFELIADLLATEWFYNKIVRQTPDTDEYRAHVDSNTYGETIFDNSLRCIQSQLALLILSAIAGAQRFDGKISLVGGQTHPPGIQRHQLQFLHLMTLIESNFSDVLISSQWEILKNFYHDCMDILIFGGIISLEDLESALDPNECDTVEAAADIIEKFEITELTKIVESLRSTRESLLEKLKKNF